MNATINKSKSLSSQAVLFAAIAITIFSGSLWADTIIDNTSAATAKVGTWSVSGAAGFYGTNSVYARNPNLSFSWLFTPTESGYYEVSMWWTEFTSRSTSAPVEIQHADGTASTTVNQQANGGKWNVLGQYNFIAGTTYRVTVRTKTDNTTISADAVQFVKLPPPTITANFTALPVTGNVPLTVSFTDSSTSLEAIETWEWDFTNDGIVDSTEQNPVCVYSSAGLYSVRLTVSGLDGTSTVLKEDFVEVIDPNAPIEVIIDNRDASVSSVGTWVASGATGFYAADSVYARNANLSFSWLFTPEQSGDYDVYMWWTEYTSRSSAAPVEVQHAGGTASMTVNQKTNGGKWNLLGHYSFIAGTTYRVTVRTKTDNTTISADAVRFVKMPPAPISANFSATPVTGDLPLSVSFSDLSTTTGVIESWDWDFENDGVVDSVEQNPVHVYTAAGTYTVRLAVSGSEGADVLIKENLIKVVDPYAPYEVIIDNSTSGLTSSTGTWSVSGGTPCWGANSLWARYTASYTWRFTPQFSGVFEIYMWWTEFSSRGSALPVSMQHYFGTAQTTINQQTNGGKWNLLGTYYMQAGSTYNVTLNTMGGTPTACADAVRFVKVVVDNLSPYAAIDSITPNPAMLGQEITFSGSALDVDGSIAEYEWSSDIDGLLSTGSVFAANNLSGGVHTISLRAKDDDGAWSMPVTKKVIILNSAEIEHVYACFGYGSERPNYQWEDMLVNIGAIEVDNLWVYTNPSLNKSFVIHTVNSIEGMHAAMKEPDSHILFYGHSNYGLGPIFPTSVEQSKQVIEELYYVDDDRFFNYSTDTIAVSVSGMIGSQAYPNWYPNFKDGTSAIAPYNFGDPRGNPPHNYYLTYQVPGDPTFYKIETARTAALTRFPDSGKPAWYSSTGTLPNPSNPSHLQYFIRNTSPWDPPFETTAGWLGSIKTLGFYGSNYLWVDAGNGDKQAKWSFTVPFAGPYEVAARWTASSGRTSAAPYTITHALGDATVLANQKVSGGVWNSLGTYEFTSSQDWYESRNNVPTLVTLNQADIGGNNTKKAAFTASLSGNAYLTQPFKEARNGIVHLEWDIYMDNILNDSTRDRGGMMLVGADVGSGPNQGSGQFVYMAFWCEDGGGEPGDGKAMNLVAREPGDSFDISSQWRQIASGVEFDRWYKIGVTCDTINRTYDVYIDGVLMQSGVIAANILYDLTHISFAQWNDGAGAFYVDNVYGDTPDMLVDNIFDDSVDSADLRARDAQKYFVTLTNNTASGNVIADAIRISHPLNPPTVLQADFYAATRSGTAPLDVTFTSQSTGSIESLTWDFGDGTPTVKTSSSSITHTYQSNGMYSVRLTAASAGGSSAITKTGYVTVGAATPQQVEFSASSREGVLPRNVSFRNRSSGSIKSVLWDFGDGQTSTSSNPTHSYFVPGNYNVTLTVIFNDNKVKTLSKTNFVRAIVYEKFIDNINYPNYHYGSKTILMRGPLEINPAEMKYKRMFILSCNSGPYYLQTLGRGIVFYSLDDTEVNPGTGFSLYLRAYMLGQSNDQILNALLAKQAAFDYFDFNKRPQDQ